MRAVIWIGRLRTNGNSITYTITINNAGPSGASSVTLSDTLPAGTTLPPS